MKINYKTAPILGFIFFTLGLALLSPHPSISKETEEITQSIEDISYLVGHWGYTQERYQNGEWVSIPLEESARKAEFYWILDKNLIRQVGPVPNGGNPYILEFTFSYDRPHKMFRVSLMGSLMGLMDIYEGDLKGDILTLSNHDTGTSFPGSSAKFEFTKISDNRHDIIIYVSQDKGETWILNSRYKATRVDPS